MHHGNLPHIYEAMQLPFIKCTLQISGWTKLNMFILIYFVKPKESYIYAHVDRVERVILCKD